MADIFDKENQMILRVPDEIADRLNELFEDESENADNFIDITPFLTQDPQSKGDITQFKFKFENFESTATLVDLPCIVESMKSVDSINLFKSNDISQMIYVHPNKEKFLEEVPKSEKIAKKVMQSNDPAQPPKPVYLARDGLTPPTKCIRSRYFRKDFPVPPKEVRKVEEKMSLILDEIKKNKKDGDGGNDDASEYGANLMGGGSVSAEEGTSAIHGSAQKN